MFNFIRCLLINFRLLRLIFIFSTIFMSKYLLLQTVRRVCSSFPAHEVYSGGSQVSLRIQTLPHTHTHTHTHTYICIYICKAVKLTPSPETQEPDRLQYDRPAACVIAQQYSVLPPLPYHFAFITERKYPARIKKDISFLLLSNGLCLKLYKIALI